MTTKLIPREVLFGNPDKAAPQISPDGKKLAYIAPVDGVLNVWVGEVGSDDFKPVTHDTDRGVRSYGFMWDNRHLFWIQDKGGDENWRLYDVDLVTGEERDLTPFDKVQVRLIAADHRHPEEMLVGINKDDAQLHDVYRLDVASGKLEKVLDNPGFIDWVADVDHNVRAGIRPRPDAGQDLLVRDGDGDEWRVVVSWDIEDALLSNPAGFTLDGKSLYLVSSQGTNASRLEKLDLATGERDVIAEDPEYDLLGATIHHVTREVQMVTFPKDRLERQVLDPSIKEEIATLEALDRGDMYLVDRDLDDKVWLVAFSPDNGPVRYHSWDRAAKKATFLFDQRHELSAYELAETEPFAFEAQDGLTVHGYLTFPLGVERSNLDTVLYVHGGPWARDLWGFNPTTQWLANRGYLVVQVNYRGSAGYGKRFLNAGNREWAGKMHTDLIDAVDWVVAKGFANREKVAIYGGSYGGYAALVGATFTPDVFCCSVAICGPSNLKTFMATIPPYWKPWEAVWWERVGNPNTEEDFLWSRSPLSRVDQIKIPMLVAQGANDPRVTAPESEQVVAAMKDKGIDHEYMLFADEGHGFVKPENNIKFHAAAEAFLAKHLGGGSEPQGVA